MHNSFKKSEGASGLIYYNGNKAPEISNYIKFGNTKVLSVNNTKYYSNEKFWSTIPENLRHSVISIFKVSN